MTTRNLFVQLKKLLGDQPLQAGTVVAVGDVVSVELPGGAIIAARGEAAVDDVVYVRGGVIEGQASSLPIYTIEV